MTIKKWGAALFLAYLPATALALDYQFTLGCRGGIVSLAVISKTPTLLVMTLIPTKVSTD